MLKLNLIHIDTRPVLVDFLVISIPLFYEKAKILRGKLFDNMKNIQENIKNLIQNR